MEAAQQYRKEGILYEPIIPNIHQWPVAKLARDRDPFLKEVSAETLAQIQAYSAQNRIPLDQVVAQAMFQERIRMRENPWKKVDPKDEAKFWSKIKKRLVKNEQLEQNDAESAARTQRMLEDISMRYVEEIGGHFKPSTYDFAKRFLPFFFSTLLNASAAKTFRTIIYHSVQLQERVHLRGETQLLRKLGTKGTIVLVPTHLSNIDSILVGWGLHALGMPAFIYGAGLNLYQNRLIGYFMRRLGAYTVDRRKKNQIYRAALNAYATQATERGVPHIFFPGGGRSRSGEIEQKLKLGLLGTAIEAQRRHFLHDTGGQKIFIVPLVMSYHFVFEAKSLIKQYLNRTGQENYFNLDRDSSDIYKIVQFAWATFRKSSDIVLAIGKPMDVFGNFVDENGQSIDESGYPVNIAEYFMSRGQVTEDPQRDREYNRILGRKISERYLIENHVFSSHLVAFIAFEILKGRRRELDLYGVLRLPDEDRQIELTEFGPVVERVLTHLRNMAAQGKVHLADHMNNTPDKIIEHGLKNLGIYHAKRPLKFTSKEKNSLTSDNLDLLFYYHNRLVGYELEALI